jgi:hypothetical protein
MWALAVVGWILVTGVAWVAAPKTIWYVIAFGIATVFLVVRRSFPGRSRGLALSWVGPLLISLTSIAATIIQSCPSVSEPLTGSPYGGLAPIAVWDTGLVLVMVWLWRGYGAIPLIAAVGVLDLRSGRIEKTAEEYPWHRWWLAPLLLTGLAAAKLIALAWWLRAV